MIIVSVPLKDVIFDPSKKIDLSTLPEEEVISLLKSSYGFLSSSIEVSIQNGIAIIKLKEPKKESANEALYIQQRRQTAWHGECQKATNAS